MGEHRRIALGRFGPLAGDVVTRLSPHHQYMRQRLA